ncbi:hypothetical protein ACFL13_00885 [Patescibacteria group bacterium]
MNFKTYKTVEYAALVISVIGFIFLFWNFRFDPPSLRVISTLGSFGYVTWGVIHHYLEKRLTRLVAMEYILIGLVANLILLIVIGN